MEKGKCVRAADGMLTAFATVWCPEDQRKREFPGRGSSKQCQKRLTNRIRERRNEES